MHDFQASPAKYMGTVLLWAIMQRVLAVPYRRFGKTYRSNIQGSRMVWGRKFVPKRR